jgi:hypothetical protein
LPLACHDRRLQARHDALHQDVGATILSRQLLQRNAGIGSRKIAFNMRRNHELKTHTHKAEQNRQPKDEGRIVINYHIYHSNETFETNHVSCDSGKLGSLGIPGRPVLELLGHIRTSDQFVDDGSVGSVRFRLLCFLSSDSLTITGDEVEFDVPTWQFQQNLLLSSGSSCGQQSSWLSRWGYA